MFNTRIELIETAMCDRTPENLFHGYKRNIQEYHTWKGIKAPAITARYYNVAMEYKNEILRRGYSPKAFTGNLKDLRDELKVEFEFNRRGF